MELLQVNNLCKEYTGGTKALDDISFSVDEKEFVTIIGPSGAGKSTLLRCFNKLIDYTDGEIIFDNKVIKDVKKKDLRKLRTNIGMIFQHYNLVDRLSVVENVLHGRLGYKSSIVGAMGIYSEKEKQDAFNILKKLGLEDQAYKRCDQLSGGQKQRVGIARALIQNPKLLLCDEPIASLDPSSSKVIMDQIKKINKEMNITCILNLHQVDVAINYSDRIIGINGGRIVFDGKPSELTKEKVHEIYGSDYGNLIID
ncbi:phosphonate ABC transporter ATP-binding protein [Clostridium sp. MSJ-8]|uniref:phosphonate ABC transporter ATP-binding protein n=1 Tax=Clostridium sp. MSJ-8 TaxID=2841510 RepID=UPI001C0F128F|nr:phosphonate ABC transporter ATP-binding protein [Clostridium sp. MSJ-8]MBU5487713.1 phosphonate ABC transporter ATP-binding protein [Clostridium sp. MSJ-8]